MMPTRGQHRSGLVRRGPVVSLRLSYPPRPSRHWRSPLFIWALRAAWVSLPLLAGPLSADALGEWSPTPLTVASIELWVVWAVVLLAVLSPRPIGLTALRLAAGTAPVLAIIATPSAATGGRAAAGIAAAAVACALAMTPQVGHWCANGPAYGDERRFLLRPPPALFFGPIPLAALMLVGMPVSGSLLLADGRIVAGLAMLVPGAPLAVVLGRSLHGLAERWAVLVPAGMVLRDTMTLRDAVLFPRKTVASLGPAPHATNPGPDVADLRLGALSGALTLDLDDPTAVVLAGHTRRDRRHNKTVTVSHLLFSPTRPGDLLTTASARNLRIHT